METERGKENNEGLPKPFLYSKRFMSKYVTQACTPSPKEIFLSTWKIMNVIIKLALFCLYLNKKRKEKLIPTKDKEHHGLNILCQ